MSGPFTLSIETVSGKSDQYGFHLGTDEKLARQIIEEKFAAYVKYDLPVVTMALMRDRKIVDVFYGATWHSDEVQGVSTVKPMVLS